ncbi:MAG: PAS domain S-box protein [Desulfobacteraceae bacterium]|nr:PAS domain S-box protein [Desulfobacteraceae bacterium]
MKGIESAITTSSDQMEIHVEYLDNLRKPSILIESEQHALFLKKYGHISMSAILTTDDVALDFILKKRNKLFPDVPVVFCAPNDFKDSKIAGHKMITGVSETLDIKWSFDIILKLHPKTERIAIISDSIPSTQINLLELDRVLNKYEYPVGIVRLTDRSLIQLRDELAHQPRNTIVLFLSFLLDRHGKQYSSNVKVFQDLSSAVDLPFYTFKKHDVGIGAVGGKVISEVLMAKLAMEMVIKILNGVKPDEIPIIYKTPTIASFDYKKLKKYNINESLLPFDSQIINKPFSFYNTYKGFVWTVTIFTIFSIILITLLSVTVRKSIQLGKKLRIHSDKLEVEVTERTKELMTANTNLVQKISDHKLAQESIKQSQETLKSFFKVAPTGIGMVRNRVIVQVNDKLCKMIGYSRKDLIGKSTRVLYPTIDDYEYVGQENRTQIKAKGTGTVETLWEKRNGEILNILLSSTPIDGKDWLAGVTFTALDITKNKRAERAIKESEKKYRTLIETTDTGFVSVDSNGCVLEANETYVKMTGHSLLNDIIGRSVLEWTAPYDIERNLIEVQKCISTGEIQNLEIDYIHPDGQITPIEVFAKTLNSQKGQTIIALCRDISERKLSEIEKREAQQYSMIQEKHAIVGQIAGKMAHDFNNILGVIMGNTELSLLDCKDEEIKDTLELILGQTVRGKNLTKNLIAFAKDQEPRQEYFKIDKKIDLVLTLLKKDLEGIQLIKKDTPNVPELLADPGMIEHALVNLLQNSIHATSKSADPKISIQTYCLDHNICFEIKDNGCGIPAEHIDNIYQPSFTLKGIKDLTESYPNDIKGTGYGMANVKKYIEQHKGTISADSQVDSGTKFTICLPVIKKELTQKEKTEIRRSNIQLKKSILLVEDEQPISDVQHRILSQEPFNHKVDIANNAQIAMELFDKNTYDFVSLDYILAGEFNGMDVYNHIRKTDQGIPVLFISGNIEFLESIKDLKKKDAHIDHLSKPCMNKNYVDCINDLIEMATQTKKPS